MFNHISLGVRDIGKAKAFYDPTMKALGFACLSEDDSALGYGKDSAGLWLLQTESPVPADPKSGLHVCLTAPDRASVGRFHAAALAAGGSDNGKPGVRADYAPNYYAAFVIDPNGYRLEAVCLGD